MRGSVPVSVEAGRPHLPALTGLRFVAALHVVVYHFLLQYLGGNTPAWVWSLVGEGGQGVTLFYVLSGFVLSYTYLGPGREMRVGRRQFWIARFARVYPAYAVAGVLVVPLAVRAIIENGTSLPGALGAAKAAGLYFSLVQAWTPRTALVWNAPGWSLSAEVFFYALFPLVVPRLRGISSGRAALTVLACCLVRVTVQWLARAPDYPAGFDAASWSALLAYLPLARLPEFLIGATVGAYFVNRRVAAGPVARPRTAPAWGSLVVVVGMYLATGWGTTWQAILNGLLPLGYAGLIYGLGWGGGWLGRLLSLRAMVALGQASYSLYILQLPVWAYVLWAVGEHGVAPTTTLARSGWFFVVYALVLVVAALVSYVLVERPGRQHLAGTLRAWLLPAGCGASAASSSAKVYVLS